MSSLALKSTQKETAAPTPKAKPWTPAKKSYGHVKAKVQATRVRKKK